MRPLTTIVTRMLGAILCVILTAAQADAQPRTARSFEQLQVLVKSGDRVGVEEATGEKVSGRILSLTSTELVLVTGAGRRTFHAGEALRIRQRRGDPLSNGAWTGLGIGVGLIAVAAIADDSNILDGPILIVAGVIYGSLGASIGAGVDALIRRQQVIYDSSLNPSRSLIDRPQQDHHRIAVSHSWRF